MRMHMHDVTIFWWNFSKIAQFCRVPAHFSEDDAILLRSLLNTQFCRPAAAAVFS